MNQPRTIRPTPCAGIKPSWDTTQDAGAYSMQQKKKSSKAWLWVLGILGLVVVLCGGGIAGFFIYVASVADSNVRVNSTRVTTNSTPARSNNSSSWTPT